MVFFFPFRNESWWSALASCQLVGGSLPEFHTRDQIIRLMEYRNITEDEESYIIYIGLHWVRLHYFVFFYGEENVGGSLYKR